MFSKPQPLAYLAGPITGCERNNIDAFREAQKTVESRGYKAIVPHDLFKGYDTTGYKHADYMKRCYQALILADVIVLLPNWRHSKGANLEVQFAQEIGIKLDSVFTLDSVGPPKKRSALRVPVQLVKIYNTADKWVDTHMGWFLSPEKNYKNQNIER